MAEKLHADTRQYAGGRPSSRVKDLVDLVLIAAFLPIEGRRLKAALQTTFDARSTHPLPLSLPPPPPDWRAAYAKMAAEVSFHPELEVGYEHAKRFLDPLLAGSVSDDARWDPLLQSWQSHRRTSGIAAFVPPRGVTRSYRPVPFRQVHDCIVIVPS